MTDNRFYVYMLFRADGRTPLYIGKGHGNRWTVHERWCRRSSCHKSNAVRQILDRQGFIYKIKVASGLSESTAFALECSLIEAYGRHPNGPLLNRTAGGAGASGFRRVGWVHSEEAREKIRETNSGERHWSYGKPCREKTKIAVGNAARGRVDSEETRQRRSEAARGNGGNTGRKFTEEHREKIRLAMTGKRASAETRAKISEARRKK